MRHSTYDCDLRTMRRDIRQLNKRLLNDHIPVTMYLRIKRDMLAKVALSHRAVIANLFTI